MYVVVVMKVRHHQGRELRVPQEHKVLKVLKVL
jgi:hypothetical protein